MRMVANVWVETNEDVNENDLRDYLISAVCLDINCEEYGNMVQSIDIDWDSLRHG